jgi:hypothetical protein
MPNLLILIGFIISGACLAFIFYQAIQEGQILGGWQRVLKYLYAKGFDNLEKFLGGCYMCFSHFMGIVTFVVYGCLFLSGWQWLLYILFVPTFIVVSLMIKKL